MSDQETVRGLLRGAFDLHVHSAPDVLPRKFDDVELAKRTLSSGMAGFVLKSHYICTADRATMLREMFPAVQAFGALSLNNSVGGLNPIAVDIAGRLGNKVVWFPTVDSANELANVQGQLDESKLPYWMSIAREMRALGIRMKVDWSEGRPGEKFNHWELKGVPLRLAVGPRDIEAREAQLADRLTSEKRQVPIAGLAERVREELAGFQKALFERALEFRDQNTFEHSTLEGLVAHFRERGGFVWAPWCGSDECEARVKEETGGVTTRNFDDREPAAGSCLVCGRPAAHRVAFGRAY